MTTLPAAEELRALHAQARGWARVLRLPFHRQRWRGQSGDFMGSGTGSSLDFQDHRVYQPGDDPRQINWQAYARTGDYTMKLYREEVRPLVDVGLDVSASMFVYPAKRQRVLELLACVVEASLQSGASLRVHVIRGVQHRHVDQELLLAGRWQDILSELPTSDEAPALARLHWRAGAMRVLISDLLFQAEPDRLLAGLCQGQGRGVVLAPFCLEEANPAWDGNYEFEDVETQTLHPHRLDAEGVEKYLQAYARHFELWKNAAVKHGAALARVPAEGDFIRALRTEGIPSGAVAVV